MAAIFLCLLYFPATVLFTCIKSWFFKNHLGNCHQISHWSYSWNVLRVYLNDHASLTVLPYIIFFFKIKNCLNDDLFISCDDRIGKKLHNICISAVAMSLRWATRGPWASCCVLSLFVPHLFRLLFFGTAVLHDCCIFLGLLHLYFGLAHITYNFIPRSNSRHQVPRHWID